MRLVRPAAFRSESGEAFPEYPLIVALTAVVVIAAALALSGRILQVLRAIGDVLR